MFNSIFAGTCPERPVNNDVADVKMMAHGLAMKPYLTDSDVRHSTSRNMHINVVSLLLFLRGFLLSLCLLKSFRVTITITSAPVK